MVEDINESYSKTNCIQEKRTSFYIVDSENGCLLIEDPESATCFIENKSAKSLFFISIDNCLISNNDIRKCDLAVTDDINIIVFIELKEVTFTGDPRKDRQKRSKYRKEAVIQIASTINDFRNKGIDFTDIAVEGVVAFPPFVNQTNPVNIPLTASQARIAQFNSLCGFQNISEGNHIVF